MKSIDGRLFVFAGAGASKAVRPDKFPTTREFFDELLPPITDQPLFSFALDYIKSYARNDVVDIEQILWALQTLFEFYDNICDPKDISGFALRQGLLEKLFPDHSAGQLLMLAPRVRDELRDLIGEINQAVYELYSYEPSPLELKETWTELIMRFEGSGTRLDIFTTNYDVVIEAALNDILGDVTARVWRGIKGTVRQSIDLGYWLDERKVDTGLLTKLHGSLDWKLRGDQIHVGDPVFTGDHSKQAIIYPGFKGASAAPFFQPFHDYLAQSISESSVLIFIGFAFRDEYINQIIRENIRLQSRVYVVNPDKRVRFPSKRLKPIYMASGFAREAVGAIADNELGWS